MKPAKNTPSIKRAINRAKQIGVVIPAALVDVDSLDVSQICKILSEVSDQCHEIACTCAKISREERGIEDLERGNLTQALDWAAQAQVIEHVRKTYTLERQVAYSAARSDIECYCAMEEHRGKHSGRWYVTTEVDPCFREYVELAVLYLESRGLLLRHPKAKSLVRPLDESLAKGGAR